jgi:hypothetical protein
LNCVIAYVPTGTTSVIGLDIVTRTAAELNCVIADVASVALDKVSRAIAESKTVSGDVSGDVEMLTIRVAEVDFSHFLPP